jgi:hypothetical protein
MKKLLFYLFMFILWQVKAQTPATLDFSIDSSRKPMYCFHYQPQPEISYRWGFYHQKNIKKEKLPFKTSKMGSRHWNPDTVLWEDYRDSIGTYWVCLEATYTNGIKDTVCKPIYSKLKTVETWPNGFMPDSAGTKTFDIIIENISFYHLTIYNRWGAKVFESKDKMYDWNGKIDNTGALCPSGTYFYILEYRFIGENKNEPAKNGTITVLR